MELKNQKVTRQFTAEIDNENNQVVMSFASETPYLRHSQIGQYYEILKCQPQYVDTSRLEDGACQLLLDHDWQRSIGVCKKHWFANKKLYASIKFSRSNFAQGIKRDVLDQIRRNVSIGYIVNDYEVVESIDGIKTIEVTNWQPYQLTICSVPADPTVGYKRTLDDSTEEEKDIGKETQMKDAKNNKTDSTELDGQKAKEVEEKQTDVDLEDKNLDGEDLEGKSEEATEVEKETKDKQQETKQEVCPKCGKAPCECVEEKACGGEMKPQEKQLEATPVEQINPDELNIRALGEWTNNKELAEQFIAEKKSYEDFKQFIKTKDSEQSKNSIQDETKMEKRYFSVSKLINAINDNTVDTDSYEFKTNSENKRTFGNDNKRSIVLTKSDLMYNAAYRAYADGFNGTVAGSGVANGGDTLIQFQYRPDMYAENLRPQLTLEKTGYHAATSPDGRPLEWPVCISGINAGIVDLDGKLPSTSMMWRNIKLQGKKIGGIAYIPYSLLTQSAPQADAKIEADLIKDIYQIRDVMAFTGRGYNPDTTSGYYEPVGILNNPDVNTVTAASTGFVWKDFIDAEVKIRESNDFSENLVWVMSPATYGELRATPKNPSGGFVYGFICEDEKIGRYQVYANPAIPDGKVILMNPQELVLCDFQGLEIVVDPFTGLETNQIRVAGWIQFDCTLQRPKSFTVITKA